MAGIEGITAEILESAKAEAEKILTRAKTEAKGVTDAAQAAQKEALDAARESAQRKAEAQKERALSQAEMESRQTLLAEKQAIIAEVIDAARERLHAQDAEGYFAMLLQLLSQNLHAGEGELCLSKEDLARLPADFEQQAKDLAKAKAGTLALSETAAEIRDGFILRYGGIEENCSLDALFAEKAESFHDLVSGMLF